MDEIIISDRRFISAKRAAEEYGYNSDYIGQLVRSKKVHGTKVGRAWYVDEEKLNTLFERSKKISDMRVSGKTIKNKAFLVSEKVIEPLEKHSDAHIHMNKEIDNIITDSKRGVKYVDDISVSLPKLDKRKKNLIEDFRPIKDVSESPKKSKIPSFYILFLAMVSLGIGYMYGNVAHLDGLYENGSNLWIIRLK